MRVHGKEADAAFDAKLTHALAGAKGDAAPEGFEARVMARIMREGFPLAAYRLPEARSRRLGLCFVMGAAALSAFLLLPAASGLVREVPRAAERLMREDSRAIVLGAMEYGSNVARGAMRQLESD